MIYQLRYSKTAVKDIKKLDAIMRRRLHKKLALFRSSPLTHAKKLTSSQLGQYRFRVGDLRIVFDLDNHWITILRVGFRGDIYR